MVIAREPAEPNPWHSKSLEWQIPTPVPVHNFDRIPVIRRRSLRLRRPARARRRPRRRAHPESRRTRRGMNEMAESPDEAFAEPPEVQERNLWLGVRVMAGVTIMFFLAFVFAYFYLRSLNNGGHWRAPRVDPPQGYGAAIVGLFVLSAALFAYADRAARSAGSLAARGRDGAGARPRRLRGPGVRVREPRVFAPPGRLRERVPRLDPAVHGVRARRAVLAGDRLRHRPSSPRHRGVRSARPRRGLLLLDAARGASA